MAVSFECRLVCACTYTLPTSSYTPPELEVHIWKLMTYLGQTAKYPPFPLHLKMVSKVFPQAKRTRNHWHHPRRISIRSTHSIRLFSPRTGRAITGPETSSRIPRQDRGQIGATRTRRDQISDLAKGRLDR